MNCFIRLNNENIIRRLKELGIRHNDLDDLKGEYIAYNYGMYISVDKYFPNLAKITGDFDCGTDEDLFFKMILK